MDACIVLIDLFFNINPIYNTSRKFNVKKRASFIKIFQRILVRILFFNFFYLFFVSFKLLGINKNKKKLSIKS